MGDSAGKDAKTCPRHPQSSMGVSRWLDQCSSVWGHLRFVYSQRDTQANAWTTPHGQTLSNSFFHSTSIIDRAPFSATN